jgi:hypothetical protein
LRKGTEHRDGGGHGIDSGRSFYDAHHNGAATVSRPALILGAPFQSAVSVHSFSARFQRAPDGSAAAVIGPSPRRPGQSGFRARAAYPARSTPVRAG